MQISSYIWNYVRAQVRTVLVTKSDVFPLNVSLSHEISRYFYCFSYSKESEILGVLHNAKRTSYIIYRSGWRKNPHKLMRCQSHICCILDRWNNPTHDKVNTEDNDNSTHHLTPWASYQIWKVTGCACAGIASRHVRHARALMHAGIANPRCRGKLSRCMHNPHFLRIW